MTSINNTWKGGDKAQAKPRPLHYRASGIQAASGSPLSGIAPNPAQLPASGSSCAHEQPIVRNACPVTGRQKPTECGNGASGAQQGRGKG